MNPAHFADVLQRNENKMHDNNTIQRHACVDCKTLKKMTKLYYCAELVVS